MNVTASPRPTHRPRRDRRGQRFGEREHQLARRHHGGTGEDQCLGAESVEQQTGGHLCAGIHDDLKDHERRQHTRAGVEAIGGVQTGNAEGGAVEDGDDVCEQSGGPDDPGTHTEPFTAEELCPDVLQTRCDAHHLPSGRADANSETVKSLTRGCSQTVGIELAEFAHDSSASYPTSPSYSQISAYTSDS